MIALAIHRLAPPGTRFSPAPLPRRAAPRMMKDHFHLGTPMFDDLSRLERRIMAVLFRLKEATALTVAEQLDGPDTYDTVRVTLRGLERRGKVRHRREGKSHVYLPTQSRSRASRKAAVDLVRTFFADSPSQAILTLLDATDRQLTQDELDAIEARIAQARRDRSS